MPPKYDIGMTTAVFANLRSTKLGFENLFAELSIDNQPLPPQPSCYLSRNCHR